MSEINLELDSEFLDLYFEILDKKPPQGDMLTLNALKDHARKVKKEMDSLIDNALDSKGPMKEEKPLSVTQRIAKELAEEDAEKETGKLVLIVDDLGVITYQLNLLFKRMGYEPVLSQEIYDAIEKFKNNNFELVVMDLFIPTQREGLLLLKELQKLVLMKGQTTKIGMISASGKKEHKNMCMHEGASFYVEKTGDWQTLLAQTCQSLEQEVLS